MSVNEHRPWRERFMAVEVEFAAIWDEARAHQTGAAFPVPMQQWLGLSWEEWGQFMSDPGAFEQHMLQQRDANR